MPLLLGLKAPIVSERRPQLKNREIRTKVSAEKVNPKLRRFSKGGQISVQSAFAGDEIIHQRFRGWP